MRKFLAVVKHEYKKIVYKWTFLLGTLLFPLIAAGFAVIPAIIFSIKGEPTRIVIVDPSTRIAPRLRANLSVENIKAKGEQAAKDAQIDITESQNDQMKKGAKASTEGFVFVDYDAGAKPVDEIKTELTGKAIRDEILGIFRVHPIIVSVTDNVNRSNAETGGPTPPRRDGTSSSGLRSQAICPMKLW